MIRSVAFGVIPESTVSGRRFRHMQKGITMSAGAGAAAAAAAVIQATRAMGVVVTVDPLAFLDILEKNPEPVVVHAVGGFFTMSHQYLTSFRGLAFFTKHAMPLNLPGHCLRIEARKIWIPGQ